MLFITIGCIFLPSKWNENCAPNFPVLKPNEQSNSYIDKYNEHLCDIYVHHSKINVNSVIVRMMMIMIKNN